MIPFDESRFPEVISRFNASYGPDILIDPATTAPAANQQMLEKASEVERYFAEVLWSDVLDPCLDGLRSEIVAVPYRETMCESAIYRDLSLGWKAEAYLFTDDVLEEINSIRRTKWELVLVSRLPGDYLDDTVSIFPFINRLFEQYSIPHISIVNACVHKRFRLRKYA